MTGRALVSAYVPRGFPATLTPEALAFIGEMLEEDTADLIETVARGETLCVVDLMVGERGHSTTPRAPRGPAISARNAPPKPRRRLEWRPLPAGLTLERVRGYPCVRIVFDPSQGVARTGEHRDWEGRVILASAVLDNDGRWLVRGYAEED